MQAKYQNGLQFLQKLLIGRLEQLNHGKVYVRAVTKHFFNRRPRKQAAMRPGIKRAHRVVIRIEQEAEVWMHRLITRKELFQEERLKEPAGVSKVPFCGAGFWHSLDDVIFRLERFAQLPGKISNSTITRLQLRPGCRDA